MEILIVIFSWLLFGGSTSYYAVQRGRDPFAWFIIGMFLGILGLLLLFLLPPISNSQEEKEESASEEMLPEDPNTTTLYETPFRLKKWFYLDANHAQKGPLPLSLLKKEWEQGHLNQNSFVWSEGMSGWVKVGEVPQLKEELH